mgnify:CR=1 FL=1
MANRMKKGQDSLEKVMTPEEAKAMMIQYEKEAALPSLLYVTRKLGEVEGMISTQKDPDKALAGVQRDLKQLYDKLVEAAGIGLLPESDSSGIGGEG